MAPGRILAPPISTLTSVSPAPSFALLRGLLANALIPKSISAKASRSRTAPLMTTPDHPLRTADSAIISPIRAVAIEQIGRASCREGGEVAVGGGAVERERMRW